MKKMCAASFYKFFHLKHLRIELNLLYDELEYDNQSDVTDDCCDEVSVTNPPAPWRAMGIPDHRNHFHSNDGNHHCHAQFDVDVHGLICEYI